MPHWQHCHRCAREVAPSVRNQKNGYWLCAWCWDDDDDGDGVIAWSPIEVPPTTQEYHYSGPV